MFNKRASSLGLAGLLAQNTSPPSTEEALVSELVAAKTAEAVAKQEAEEAKAKLEALRKVLVGKNTAATGGLLAANTQGQGQQGQAGGGGWFGGGWGVKRSASTAGNIEGTRVR